MFNLKTLAAASIVALFGITPVFAAPTVIIKNDKWQVMSLANSKNVEGCGFATVDPVDGTDVLVTTFPGDVILVNLINKSWSGVEGTPYSSTLRAGEIQGIEIKGAVTRPDTITLAVQSAEDSKFLFGALFNGSYISIPLANNKSFALSLKGNQDLIAGWRSCISGAFNSK